MRSFIYNLLIYSRRSGGGHTAKVVQGKACTHLPTHAHTRNVTFSNVLHVGQTHILQEQLYCVRSKSPMTVCAYI